VVHANRAFSFFSGLSNGDVIGKPVESILQVVQDISNPTSCTVPEATTCSLKSQIVSSRKSCQLRVTPITDRFRNPKGGMSHLLVKIEPSGIHETPVEGAMAPELIPKQLGVHGNHRVFGTVG
jgi:hypothetical protein